MRKPWLCPLLYLIREWVIDMQVFNMFIPLQVSLFVFRRFVMHQLRDHFPVLVVNVKPAYVVFSIKM